MKAWPGCGGPDRPPVPGAMLQLVSPVHAIGVEMVCSRGALGMPAGLQAARDNVAISAHN
jgi:hypothetical protein